MKQRSISINGATISASVIAFDKDGTLFQAEPFWLALNAERKKRFLALTGDHGSSEWDRMMGVDGQTVDHNGLLALASEAEEKIAIASLLYQLIQKPWVQCIALTTRLLEEANEALDLDEAFRPYEEAVALLHDLKEAGYVVGVVTSDQHARTVECLKRIGMDQKIDFIVTPADVRHGKPNPDMLERVSRNFTIPMQELLMIGDGIVDSMMARAAGAKSVIVHPHEQMRNTLGPTADFVIEKLNEIEIKWT